MPGGPDVTTTPRTDQYNEIHRLLVAAFGRPDEAELVQRLRADGAMWHEFVKPWKGVIAAYAALSRMREPRGWACLAPVAVLPAYQSGAAARDLSQRHAFAFGTRLVAEIAEAASRAWEHVETGHSFPETIVVLGKPSFYERAGFSAERARKLVSPYGIEHTSIARAGDDVPCETLVYPAAFD